MTKKERLELCKLISILTVIMIVAAYGTFAIIQRWFS